MVPRDLNRRAVESLIKAGAFDSLGLSAGRCAASGPIIDSVTADSRKNIAGQLDLSAWAATTPKARASAPFRCRTCRNSPGRSL